MDRADTDIEWARWAVARWAGFPVARVPRPLVLVGPDQWPEGGFRSGDAKLAFLYGRVEADVALPETVLAALRARPHQAPSHRGPRAPLVITGAARSETEFLTDRGRRVLPAWRLTVSNANGPIWVLDPDVASQAWAPEEPPSLPPPFQGSPHRSISATVGPDDRTLTFYFTGADAAFEEYTGAELVESAQAIAVVPVVRDIGPSGPRRLVGHRREVAVGLNELLGRRVLVDLDGSPGQVTVVNGYQ